ncbi:uncharacterized protein BDZ99DRAFT_573172 [Mytilinidion resinicola]|uniref:Uncharacterized protein n=1 Tax=Mytilinidion resinicola TaxID=574789 RepID=A0A6A6YH25_9PEZI|nr:uncharacterized protein BDZ99DRAFT_573172 [Mytilinidion resinicola]KAF2807315.1 hypothetical protein BDZ99DRAFT_573172 [Mytilinidion resinicola]
MRYHLTAETNGGHFRPKKFRWKLSSSPAGKSGDDLWSYRREKDIGAAPGQVRFEALYGPDGNPVSTSFKHNDASQGVPVHTLSFRLPNGEEFQWQTNHPISTLDGFRWDYQRYALFRLSRGVAWELVADNAPWDGRGKKPLESADALAIRARNIDHSMAFTGFKSQERHDSSQVPLGSIANGKGMQQGSNLRINERSKPPTGAMWHERQSDSWKLFRTSSSNSPSVDIAAALSASDDSK